MKQRRVIVGRQADADIRRIAKYIALMGAGPATAARYVERLEVAVNNLDLATERGIDLSHISRGLRLIAFESSANLAVKVYADRAVVIRVFYRGQDWDQALRRHFRKP